MVRRDEPYYHDRDLWQVLSKMEVTGHEADVPEDELPEVTIEVELPGPHVAREIEERTEFLAIAEGEEPATEVVIDGIVEDVARALQAEYNTVGHDDLEEGLYEPHHGNDHQWKKVPESDLNGEYKDLLREVTDEHDARSVPGLRRPFLEACAESPEHDIPPRGRVDELVKDHIEDLRREEQSRAAVSELKQRLEGSGVNPRTAASIAQNMDDLLVSDAELAEREDD